MPYSIGVVYLFRCVDTGVYKFGASINPAGRFDSLQISSMSNFGFNLVYEWSIITNGLLRLERYWCARWKPFRRLSLGLKRREWVDLPESEVKYFRSFGSIRFRGPKYPEITRRIANSLSPLQPDHKWRSPRYTTEPIATA
jgi:hypothetical protein